ncbi:MAG TPA: hypothetical protein VNO79_09105 [Actinomycetota bacterium]|nr:hypothetical protein [Actinomycetota bacterium]
MEVDVERLTVRFTERSWVVELRFEEIAHRLECVGLQLQPAEAHRPRPLTTSAIRRLRVATLIDRGREALLSRGVGPATAFDAEAATAEVERHLAETRYRKPLSHWVRVAEVYARAVRAGNAPTKAVAQEFGVSYTRAAKYVTRARGLGLLTKEGKGQTSRPVHLGRAELRASASLVAEGEVTEAGRPPEGEAAPAPTTEGRRR